MEKKLKILVAEDNPVNLEIILYMLEGKGDIDIAGDGQEALGKAWKANYDIIFMDVQMPIMNGLEAAAKIKEMKGKNSPLIIAMTANALSGDREKCISAGMDDYIAKPINISDIDKIIGKYCPQKKNEIIEECSNETIDYSIFKTLCEINKMKPMFLNKIYTLFFKETENYIEKINENIKEGKTEEIAKIIHKVKGSATSVGAKRLGIYCENWEADYQLGIEYNLNSFAEGFIEIFEQTKKEINFMIMSAKL